MNFSKLPAIKEASLPELGIFPNKFYAAVFRLWETCSIERIALALETSEDVIVKAAQDMGLPKQQCIEKWQTRGYITTIRNAWHILPYEQIMTLLDCDEEKFATIIKEDDFLAFKLGDFKPLVKKVTPEIVDEKELLPIKKVMQEHFSDFCGMILLNT